MITISAFADEIAPDLATQMDVCESQGVRCIDVRNVNGRNVSQLTVEEAAECRKQLDARGFRVPCIGSPIGKIKISDDFDAHLDLLKHCFDVARAFGTSRIRVFSFYASKGAEVADERDAVMARIGAMAAAAEAADCTLMHENEKRIYGARPEGVKDIFATIRSASLRSIFDPANFVEEGVAPYDDAWCGGLNELTAYFHIKDKKQAAGGTCVPAGEGAGQIDRILADLKARDWSGTMTLEPHLKASGQFAGHTGPDLFGKAVSALKGLCDRAGIAYQ